MDSVELGDDSGSVEGVYGPSKNGHNINTPNANGLNMNGSHGRVLHSQTPLRGTIQSHPSHSHVVSIKQAYDDASPIDLSLASSYLPGIYAMLKVMLLLATLNITQKLGMQIDQAIIICAACLYIDRCLTIRYILDTDACALCVLVSVCVNAARIGLHGEPGVVNMIISIIWACVSNLILCDAHRHVLRHVPFPGLLHVVTSALCAVHGFLYMDTELDVVAYTRGLVFCALCVLWVYTLNQRDLRDAYNDCFSSCIDRFAVILLIDIYVAVLYMVIALVVIMWRYRQSYQVNVPSADVVSEVGTSFKGSAGVVSDVEYPPDDMDVHTAFRLAQENARKGHHAR
ncbi:hypothetical protein T484DRAFT_1756995 [Baffinella frigidus]|nr:hypothetical protein T484DRAFT_1756995 [Cryptophyta sp. CCMP2293]